VCPPCRFTFTSFAFDNVETAAAEGDYLFYDCGIAASDPTIANLPAFSPNQWSFAFNDRDGY
jgi:hypothetical protein